MPNVKAQMTKSKQRSGRESGKTSSERELYFFDNQSEATRTGATQFWVEGGVTARMLEKIWLSGEERVFSRPQGRNWRQKGKCQMSKLKCQKADEE